LGQYPQEKQRIERFEPPLRPAEVAAAVAFWRRGAGFISTHVNGGHYMI
jgi:hypothetical protein